MKSTLNALHLAIGLCAIFLGGCDRKAANTASLVPTRQVHFAGQSFTVVEVDLRRVDLNLYYRTPEGGRIGTLPALRDMLARSGQTLLFATNGGIFHPDFRPCGLQIQDGVESSPLNAEEGLGNFYLKSNGVFWIDDQGARIIDAARYSAPAAQVHVAMQSGPLLVIDGKIHPKFDPHSQNKRLRSGVGVVSPDRVVFAISHEPVTFYDFASLFQRNLKCEQALYLDGEISAFYFPSDAAQAPVHEFAGMLGVTAKRSKP